MRQLSKLLLLSSAMALVLPVALHADDAARERDLFTALLEDNLSGAGRKVVVTGFKGALSSKAQMESLTIADDEGVWITLKDVVLDWNRLAVLAGNISVNELSAAEVDIARLPQSEETAVTPEATGFALPELPVSVAIRKLKIDHLSLGAPILGEAVTAELEGNLTLSGGEGAADITLERQDPGKVGMLDLNASYANASGQAVVNLVAEESVGGIAQRMIGLPGDPSVRLTVAGEGPLSDFDAKLQLATDGVDRLQGQLHLNETPSGGQGFAVDIGGDLAELFLPEYRAFFGSDLKLVAAGEKEATGNFVLSQLSVDAQALTLNGAGVIAGSGLPQKLWLEGSIGLADGSAVVLPIGGEGETRLTRGDIRFDYDALKEEGWRGHVTMTGLKRDDLALEQAELRGSGRIAARPASAGGVVVGGRLGLSATGVALSDPALATALGDALTGQAVFAWQPEGEGLRLPQLTLAGDGYGLKWRGSFGALSDGLPLKGVLEAHFDDLARLSGVAQRPLSGAAEFSLSGQGSPLGGDFDIEAEASTHDASIGVPEVDNLLAGEAKISLSALRDANGLRLRDLQVNSRAITAEAQGMLSSTQSDLQTRFAFSDLGVMGAGYGGALALQGTVSGNLEDASLRLSGEANDLRLNRPEDADGLLRGRSELVIDLTKTGSRFDIRSAEVSNPQARIDLSGFGDLEGPSRLHLEAKLNDLSAAMARGRGALDAQVDVSGTPDQLRVELSAKGSNLGVGQAEADRILAGQTALSAALLYNGARLEIERANLSNPQLTALVNGKIEGSERRLVIESRLANLGLILPEFGGALQTNGVVLADGTNYSIDLKTQGPGGIDAVIAGRLGYNFDQADLRVSGRSQAALANPFLGSRSISGGLEYDLRLNGPLALSALSGTARLSNGRFVDPALPLGFEAMDVNVQLSGGRATVNAALNGTTGGRVRVNGPIGMSAPYSADLAIAIEALVLRDPALYEAVMSGRLTLAGALTGGARIAGQIDMGDVELRVPSSGFDGGADLPGLRHVGETPAVRQTLIWAGLLGGEDADQASATSLPFGLDVVINAPSRVFLRGRGLDAEVGGQIALRGDTGHIVPSGELDLIRGRFDVLGKRLDLTTARVVMQGNLIPILDVVASNESDGIITSVEIDGPADDPVVSFTSSPELPQEEVLARLLFGRGIEHISALQAARLAAAVATLAGRGGEGIIGKLRNGFGLDDLDLQTDAEGNATLKAGKYIADNVYTEIEVDGQGRSNINLNLDVKQGVTVRGWVGESGNGGLGVFVDKDY